MIVENVETSFDRKILDKISFKLTKGSCLGILGVNGIFKNQLLK